jgi:hypothetical protein
MWLYLTTLAEPSGGEQYVMVVHWKCLFFLSGDYRAYVARLLDTVIYVL